MLFYIKKFKLCQFVVFVTIFTNVVRVTVVPLWWLRRHLHRYTYENWESLTTCERWIYTIEIEICCKSWFMDFFFVLEMCECAFQYLRNWRKQNYDWIEWISANKPSKFVFNGVGWHLSASSLPWIQRSTDIADCFSCMM